MFRVQCFVPTIDFSCFGTKQTSRLRRIVFFTVTEVPRMIKFLSFFFYFCTLLLFDLISLSFVFTLTLFVSSLLSQYKCYVLLYGLFIRIDLVSLSRGLDEDAVYVCVCVCSREFSDTFTFQLCLDSNRYFTKPLYLHIDMYTQMRNASVRKFNDNLLFCILDVRVI